MRQNADCAALVTPCPRPHEEPAGQELREARRYAELLLERQRQFAADASHELRTPLTAIRVQVEEARLHPGDIDLPDLLDHVTGDLDRLEGIVDDLLLLATIETGLDGRLEQVDLTTLVETAAAHDVRLDLEPAVTVEAAPCLIARLLANLLDNARRHVAHTLQVSLRRAGGRAELAVTDDGQGVPPADRERIFERFARLDTARSRNRGGAGLGLAIARDIAAAHHGTLHVENADDGGARFVLRLPLVR
ncbi:HAMP domain-containing histidine kinase [Nonomuraea terrae]|uniref:histidine kinase n=1 Tax=Nonomuraea terrae TaxID=2530383 RepID=A0A4R4XWM8_9ACTN|nr:HAMP domain-containing sensor histidine kinase [Nonomuraea terrae]TDD35710.1 HAMP domain-containing histidine kinase [Nonomuraea terrae]